MGRWVRWLDCVSDNVCGIVYWRRHGNVFGDWCRLVLTSFLCVSDLVDGIGWSGVLWWQTLLGFAIVVGDHVEVDSAVREASHRLAMIAVLCYEKEK